MGPIESFAIESAGSYPWDYIITRVPKSDALAVFLDALEDQEYAFGMGSISHVMIFFNEGQLSAFKTFKLDNEAHDS